MPFCVNTGRRICGDAAASLANVWKRLPDQFEAGVDVSREGQFPPIHQELVCRILVLLDRTIIDGVVDCVDFMDGRQDSLLTEDRVRDVSGNVHASAAELPDRCRCFLGFPDLHGTNDDCDVSTFTCGQARHGAADAGGRTGDQSPSARGAHQRCRWQAPRTTDAETSCFRCPASTDSTLGREVWVQRQLSSEPRVVVS